MKASWIYLTALIVLLSGGLAINHSIAQETTETESAENNIAVCDVVAVFNNYIRTQDMTGEMAQRQRRLQELNADRAKRAADIEAEIKNLKPDSEQHTLRTEELWRLQFEQEGWQKAQMGVLMKWHHKSTEQMYKQIVDMVNVVAKEMGLDLVLLQHSQPLQTSSTEELIAQISGRTVLYHSPKVDITAKVLASINEQYRQSKTAE